MRQGVRLSIAVCLLLLSGLVQGPTYTAGPAATSALVGTLPSDMQGTSNLTCPSATLCLALAYPGDGGAIAVGTGARDTWTVTHLPHPSGEIAQLAGVACSSPNLCYAWGSAGAATVWVSTAPAAGSWQREVLGAYPNAGWVQTVTCPGANLCVADSDAFVNGESLGGTAWVTQDLLGGTWSGTPLDSAYRMSNVDCVDVMCVAEGQSKVGSVQESVWSTADVRTGTWTRTEPVVPGNSLDGLHGVDCLSASLCVSNALGVSGDGAIIDLHSGYFTSTAPTTGVWDWHGVNHDAYAIGPLFCRTVGECLVYDDSGLSVDLDPTDDVPPTLAQIQHQYPLNLHGVFCLDASTCLAWGSDSGAASAGPLVATKVWRGPSVGGTWASAGLPLPVGHGTEVPEAETLACVGLTCTAVGSLTSPDYPFEVTLSPVVWTAGADGVWHVVAAGTSDGGGGGGGGGTTVTKVTTKVTLALRGTTSRPRLAGRVKALHGCQKARRVKVVGKLGLIAATVKSDLEGRYSVRLTSKLRSNLGAKVRVKVTGRWRGTDFRCLAASSTRVRL